MGLLPSFIFCLFRLGAQQGQNRSRREFHHRLRRGHFSHVRYSPRSHANDSGWRNISFLHILYLQ